MAGSDVRWTNEALTRCGRAPSLGAMTTLIDTAVTAQVEQLAQRAREASRTLALLSRAEKDAALHAMADALEAGAEGVLAANADDVSRAENEQKSRGEILHQIEQLRDSVSGVSIDEEAALMLRFQRAYEANARFFAVIDETITTLLSLKR